MIKIVNLFAVLTVVVSAFSLYWMKNEVRSKAAFIETLHQDIANERAALGVLKAEWSYLDRPAQLQQLANRYLELRLVETDQIVTLQDLQEILSLVSMKDAQSRSLPDYMPGIKEQDIHSIIWNMQ